MILTINNIIATIFFITILFSSSSDRPLILIMLLAFNIILIVHRLYNINPEPYWELQREQATKGVFTGMLYLLIYIMFGIELIMYLGLFTIGQSIITSIFFSIYERIL